MPKTKAFDPMTAMAAELGAALESYRLNHRLSYDELARQISAGVPDDRPMSSTSVFRVCAGEMLAHRETTLHPIRKFLVGVLASQS